MIYIIIKYPFLVKIWRQWTHKTSKQSKSNSTSTFCSQLHVTIQTKFRIFHINVRGMANTEVRNASRNSMHRNTMKTCWSDLFILYNCCYSGIEAEIYVGRSTLPQNNWLPKLSHMRTLLLSNWVQCVVPVRHKVRNRRQVFLIPISRYFQKKSVVVISD